jgi:hypothetical protein
LAVLRLTRLPLFLHNDSVTGNLLVDQFYPDAAVKGQHLAALLKPSLGLPHCSRALSQLEQAPAAEEGHWPLLIKDRSAAYITPPPIA